MKQGLTQTLLGLLKPNARRSTFDVRLLAVAFLAVIQLLAGIGEIRATMFVNNNASLSYTDYGRNTYAPVQDTAGILVMAPPNITISKDVYNIRTGETSPDVVIAIRSDTVEFILRFTNIGETDAFRVTMSDSIPAGTVYIQGSAIDTNSLDPVDPPDTVSFQHVAGGPFDSNDGDTITAIRWEWDKIDNVLGNNSRISKFRVRVE